MSKTRSFWGPLVALIILGSLILGAFVFHRIGWTEGYRMGQLTASAGDGAVVPYAPYGPSCGGLFLTLGVIFLMLLAFGTIFRLWAWKMGWGHWMMAGESGKMPNGPKSKSWAEHWHRHRHHGPMPPWCWDWEEPAEEPEADAEDDAVNKEQEA